MTAVVTRSVADGPGTTTVTERAVERIATRLLTDVEDVGGSSRQVLGVAVTRLESGGDARVTAQVDGTTVRLEVRLSVTYPASVRRVTEAARAYLTRRVGELSGLTVRAVDIVVTALSTPDAAVRRVE